MVILMFVVAVICMVIGHIFKIKRWGLFISVYEEPKEGNLLNSMTIGHTLNTILPIRIGDIVRIILSGRKLKNGKSFSLATVFVDLYIDFLTVGFIFCGLSILGKGGEKLLDLAQVYLYLAIVAVTITLFSVAFRKIVKNIIRGIASIFNEKIEFKLLYVSYLCIASLKDIFKNINKAKFILYSVGIWSGYIASYAIFAEVIQAHGFNYSTSDVFTELFLGSSLYHIDKALIPIWSTYLLLPLLICGVISLIVYKKQGDEVEAKKTLPHLNQADRLAFLKTYYEDESRNHIQAYLGINSDVTVVEDNSAGSNASTLLVMKSEGNFLFRKYAFDEDGEKLYEQVEWIEAHQSDIPLPIIVDKRKEDNYTTYDMHSYGKSIGMFKYIHTMSVESSWGILEKSLNEIGDGLHIKNNRNADLNTVVKYIEGKVDKNLKIILEDDKYIKALEQYDEITVNGQKLRTLKHYKDLLKVEHLTDIFKNDKYSDIHGDLTIENIVCLTDESELSEEEYVGKVKPHNYYFIDPNTGNVHDSPFLDYGKLLQSLHGNYEFLMMVTSVKIDKNKVNYMSTKSDVYVKIYKKYKEYLQSRFTKEEVLSIYYHEVIHWLRLMPYKIRKNEKLAVVFYTGLLTVLDDVWEMEYGEKK